MTFRQVGIIFRPQLVLRYLAKFQRQGVVPLVPVKPCCRPFNLAFGLEVGLVGGNFGVCLRGSLVWDVATGQHVVQDQFHPLCSCVIFLPVVGNDIVAHLNDLVSGKP